MSVNVYLIRAVKGDASFKNEERDKRSGGKYQHVEWAAVRLSHIDNSTCLPVYTMNSLDDEFPDAIPKNYVHKVTAKETFTGRFQRRIGVYLAPNESDRVCEEKGRAILDLQPTTGNYELEIKAFSLNDARELYHGIRSGRLVPDEPWDELQKGEVRSKK